MSRLRRNAGLAALCCTLVGGFEGVRTIAYKDPIGLPTACFGETKNIRMGMSFTMDQCKGMLLDSLIEHEDGMQRCLGAVTLPDKTHAAALSFTYNVGVGNFCSSTFARKLKAGDIAGACNELPKWVYARGIKFKGLENRRAAERELCLQGLT
jgi:lysozyme